MNAAELIGIVQEYEELYNLRHKDYCNQQRRDNIWEEIGIRMNQPSADCKIRWTRIRDNHRKALNLRKTKSSKLKPPKYHQELQFLIPYLTDDEKHMTQIALSPVNLKDEESDAEYASAFQIPACSPAASDTESLSSNISKLHGRRKKTSGSSRSQLNTPSVLEKYLKSKEQQTLINADPLMNFFINMAQTVKTFPLKDQVFIKGQLFNVVNSVEMRLVQEQD